MVLLVALFSLSQAVVATAEPPLWFWFESCAEKSLSLEVALDGKVVHHSDFAICNRQRSASSSEAKKLIEFSFTSPRSIEWKGYRDDGNVTPVGATIEVDIWQAGAEADSLILGISVEADGVLYMNTLHVARAELESQTSIEPGLVVRTFVPHRSPKSQSN